jgi:Fe-S cluster assembly ATP-binding protein
VLEIDQKFFNAFFERIFQIEEKTCKKFSKCNVGTKIAILDETDSGLDIDALRIVANGLTKLKSEKYHCGYTVTKRLLRLYRS